MEACPQWLVHPVVQYLPCGAVVHAGHRQNCTERGSPSYSLVPNFAHSEQQWELLHPFAGQEGPCLGRGIAPARQGMWDETRVLTLLASVPGVDWTADMRAMSQTPEPGGSILFLAAAVTGLAESTGTFGQRLSPERSWVRFLHQRRALTATSLAVWDQGLF